jgi:hypothetical protein
MFPQRKACVVTVTLHPFPNHDGNWILDEKNAVDYTAGEVLVIFALLG